MPNFTYTRDIPFPSHNPSNDQPPMRVNTNSTDDIFEVDHYSFNVNNGGYHKVIRQPIQLVDPGALANIGQTYTKTLDGEQNLYFESGTGTKYNIVNKSLSGLITITNVTQILPPIIPNNCIGYIIFTDPTVPFQPSMQSFTFSAFGGLLYVEYPRLYGPLTPPTPIVIGTTGAPGSLQLTYVKSSGPDIVNSAYRFILWPLT